MLLIPQYKDEIPKPPLTPYMLFMKSKLPKLKRKHPDLQMTVVASKLGTGRERGRRAGGWEGETGGKGGGRGRDEGGDGGGGGRGDVVRETLFVSPPGKKWNMIGHEKQERYKQQHVALKAAYETQLQRFYEEHPDAKPAPTRYTHTHIHTHSTVQYSASSLIRRPLGRGVFG